MRIRQIFFFLFSVFNIINLSAEKLGQSKYEFLFEVKTRPQKELDYYDYNLYTLQLGDDISKFFSKRFERKIQVTDSIMSSHGKQQALFSVYNKEDLWEVKPNFEIFKFQGKKPHLIRTEYLGSHYLSKESLPTIEWTLLEGDSIVCGQQCNRAIGTFRGVEWNIWYCPDLPIDNGPWKLGGAPGMILKAEDSNKYFSFECVAIQNKSEDILFHKEWKYEEKKPSELASIIKRFNNNQVGMMEGLSGVNLPDNIRENINRKRTFTEFEIFK